MTKFHWMIASAALALPAMAGAGTGAAVVAIAAGGQAAAVAVPVGAKPKKDRLICRKDQDFETGSHLRSGKKCLRESEWKEREDSAQRFMVSVDDRSRLSDIPKEGGMSPQ